MPGGTSRYSSEENSGYDGYEDDFELEGELELDAGPEVGALPQSKPEAPPAPRHTYCGLPRTSGLLPGLLPTQAEGSTAGAAEHGGALEEEDPGEPYPVTRSTGGCP